MVDSNFFYRCLFCQNKAVFQSSDMISSQWRCEICFVIFRIKHLSLQLLSLSFLIPHEGEIYYLEINLSSDNTEIYKFGFDKAIIKLDCALKNIEPENVLHKLKLCLVFS